MLYNLKCLINIIKISFLIKERAQILDLHSEEQLFSQAIELVLHEFIYGFKVARGRLLNNFRMHSLNDDFE